MNTNKSSNKENEGEKGLAQMLIWVSNTWWKRVKLSIFETIKEKPDKHFDNYSKFSEEERLELNQFLDIEIICEVVSYAELLGVYLLAFSKKDPVIQKTLLQYEVNEIINLYEMLKNKKDEDIAELIAYPLISEFEPEMNKAKIEEYKQSLSNLKKELDKIGEFYLNNRLFYNDYKHGFRIFPTTSSPPDSPMWGATVQIAKGDSLNEAVFHHSDHLNKKAKEAIYFANRISQILEVAIQVFNDRFIEKKEKFGIRLFGIEDNQDKKETDVSAAPIQ